MRVIVLGDGLLGSEIVNQTSWDFISRKKNGIEFCNLDSFSNFLLNHDIIVNCIANTNTYSKDKNLMWSTNVVALNNLIKFCNHYNKKLVHISTDYIYTGSIENASEDDVPVHLPTWYGYTKLIGDALIELESKNYLICRLSHKSYPFPYDDAWDDIKTNCDYTNVISSLVIDLINKGADGIFNVGTEEKSLYELALKTKSVKSIKKPYYVPNNTTMNLNKLKNFL
jgi:dTDP-4-dehydrorhamnose reductase